MATAPEVNFSSCYDIKSADLSMVALVLKTADMALICHGLTQQLKESTGFFDQDPVIIDVSFIDFETIPDTALDLPSLLPVLRAHGLIPLAIKGAQGELLDQAKGVGLVDASDARIRRAVPSVELIVDTPAPVPVTAPVPLPPMLIEKPLRSGQQVYAKGRDLIVLAMVNVGAEVIADGHIHIYATLRGKAIAGARGNTEARIFALAMEPELISIAGVYRTSENALPKDVAGLPAQVSLHSGPDGDKLLVTPLKT